MIEIFLCISTFIWKCAAAKTYCKGIWLLLFLLLDDVFNSLRHIIQSRMILFVETIGELL